MEIVQFENGKFGIRRKRFLLSDMYFDFNPRGSICWWTDAITNNSFIKWCQVDSEQEAIDRYTAIKIASDIRENRKKVRPKKVVLTKKFKPEEIE